MQLIDLSQTIERGMPLFSPMAPQPAVSAWMSHADSAKTGHYEGCTCEISQVHFVTSIGTYIDSPFHFDSGGAAVGDLQIEQCVLPGIVVDCTDAAPREPLSEARLDAIDVSGKAVLFHTGWSRHWGTPAYYDFPFLTADAAAKLVSEKAGLVGVDFLVIDDTSNPHRPVHVTLLGNDILIVENLTNLAQLPAGGFTFHAAPVRVRGAAAFPVRAYAVLPSSLAD